MRQWLKQRNAWLIFITSLYSRYLIRIASKPLNIICNSLSVYSFRVLHFYCLYIIDINIASSWSPSTWKVNIYYIYINSSCRLWWCWWLSSASTFLSVGVVTVSFTAETNWFRFLQLINPLLLIWCRTVFCIASIILIFLPSLYFVLTDFWE